MAKSKEAQLAAQLEADIETVMQNIDKVRYLKGRLVVASICDVLGIPNGGVQYKRARVVAEHVKKRQKVQHEIEGKKPDIT